MWEHAADQIKSIHAMMSSGHRSVRIERHTLVLWGITGALLIVVMRWLFPPENFSIKWHRTLETVSFVQLQLIKVWWSIVALIILIQIGMSFFGGGYLFFAILLSLMGLAFYIHGLFSQQLLSWAGGIMILLGLTCIVLRLPIVTQEWLTVMVLGIGLPALSYLVHHPWHNRNIVYRVAGFAIWLLLVIVPALAVDQWQRDYKVPAIPVITLADYQHGVENDTAQHIVRVPASTVIPLEVNVNGSILKDGNNAVIPLQLSQSLDLILKDEKPTGWYRIVGQQWHNKRYAYRIRDIEIVPSVTRDAGPVVTLKLYISTDN
jgi:hypothetical protein